MPGESRRAVIIGINDYQHKSLNALQGAEKDAEEMADRLHNLGGFAIPDSCYLVGSRATADNIRTAISDLLWESEHCGFVLFYFSGHGITDGYGNGYLAPWDMLPDKPYVRGIRMQELKQMLMNAVEKDRVLAILDCCYSGAITEGKGSEPSAADPRLNEWFGAVDNEEAGRGRIILASSPKDQKSYEICQPHEIGGASHYHGAFTYHLLEGMDGKAAKGDDYIVTLAELYRHVERSMKPPAYEIRSFGADLMQVEEIELVRAKHKGEIQKFLNQAQAALLKDQPYFTFRAAALLGLVLEKSPALEPALKLAAEVNQQLKAYGTEATRWVFANRGEGSEDVYFALMRFPQLLNELSVTMLRRQTEADRNHLTYICEATRGIIPRETLFELFNSAQQSAPPSFQPLTGTAAGRI